MAFDVITGKQFTPKFEGQRTAATLADETEIDKYITEMWGKGAAPTQGFGALQSVYEANEGFRPDITFPDGTFQEGVAGSPVTRDVWYVNNQRMTEAGLAQKIADARAQLMGGGEGNPFLRTEAGLDAWRPMNMNLPQSSYYQGLDDTARAALNFDSETGFYAGGVPQINAATATAPTATTMGAPAAAPAATRQTTSVTQPDAAAAAAAEVDPAIAQREIIEKALAAKLKPIQNALAAGLLDVQAAQLAWDSARSEIYGDFLTEQTGVQQGFQTQQQADEAKRLTGRTKLLQDLNAAGVDSGMVADELALIDAIAEGSGQERMGLIGDMGRIGLMSNADRRMMGEGIFGGYEQDLRSQARQATLGAELDAAGQIQTAEERALSAGRLSDYMGIPAEALMADLYSDIDLTGMATGREEMEWGTGERLGAQDWQTGERIGAQDWQTGERVGAQTWGTSERIGGQDWQSAENVLDRTFATDERKAVQEFTSDERVASQDWAHDESIDQRDWQSAEAATGRTFSTTEREAIQDFNRLERMMSEQFTAGESATARNWQSIWNQADLGVQREQLALQTAAQEEAIRQFGVGQTFQERQFNELSAGEQADEAWRQQQFGELSASQEADLSLQRAMYNIQRQQLNEQKSQFDIGQTWREREFNELSAAEQQNLAIQQLTAGIDPATGQYRGYDPADPYAAFSPQEQYAAMAENQLPLTALLPQLAKTPEDQQKIAEFMGQFATATAMGQEVTDEAVITALASNAGLMHLIPELMGLQMQDWRTQVPGGLSPWETPGGGTAGFTPTPSPTQPSAWGMPWEDDFQFSLNPFAYDWTLPGMDEADEMPSAWTDMWGGEAGWNPLERDWRLWEGLFPG